MIRGNQLGKTETHEDPASGMTWSPSEQTHAIHSCGAVIPFRFAMTVKPSTSWRLCPMFWRAGGYVSRSDASTSARSTTYIVLETAESPPVVAFFKVATVLDLPCE